MAITDENLNTTMLVQPSGSCNYGSSCGGLFGNGDSWLGILFLIALLGGGWGGLGGFGGGYGAMMGMGMMDGFGLYPWLNNSQNINDGFRSQALGTQVGGIQNSITAGFGDVQTALCGGFAGVNQNISSGTAAIQNSLCNGFNGVNTSINSAQNALTQQLNSNEIASLNRSFAEQTANMQGFNGVNAGVADLRYTVATEACADRAAVGDALQNVTMQNMGNTNAIVNAINGGIQSIKDQLCDYRNAQKDDTIANLRQELMYSRGQASQVEQTAQLLANNNAQTALFQQGMNAEVDALYNRLKNCPVGTVPVYGNQPIFTCPQSTNNYGCGCGVA